MCFSRATNTKPPRQKSTIMALDNFFCPTGKPSKSKKSHKSTSSGSNYGNSNSNSSSFNHQNGNHNNNNGKGNSNSSNQNINNIDQTSEAQQNNANSNHHHATNVTTTTTAIPQCRYVSKTFHAEQLDEISVLMGDVVLYHRSEFCQGLDWSLVMCLRTNQTGYIPSDILTINPPKNQNCKKIPRNHHHKMMNSQHLHHHHHDHHLHPSGEPSSNGDNNNISLQGHTPRSDIPQSLHGSSGQQSLQKFPDLRQLSSPMYHNIRLDDPAQMARFDMELRPFILDNYGIFVVLHNFVAREEKDINVNPGDCVTVLNKEDSNWYWVRRHEDQIEGFVPANYICDYGEVRAILNKGNSTLTMKSINPNDFHTYINHRPTDQF